MDQFENTAMLLPFLRRKGKDPLAEFLGHGSAMAEGHHPHMGLGAAGAADAVELLGAVKDHVPGTQNVNTLILGHLHPTGQNKDRLPDRMALTGELEAAVKEKARAMGLSERVSFLGSREDMENAIACACLQEATSSVAPISKTFCSTSK